MDSRQWLFVISVLMFRENWGEFQSWLDAFIYFISCWKPCEKCRSIRTSRKTFSFDSAGRSRSSLAPCTCGSKKCIPTQSSSRLSLLNRSIMWNSRFFLFLYICPSLSLTSSLSLPPFRSRSRRTVQNVSSTLECSSPRRIPELRG